MEVAAVPLNQEELSLLAACPLFQKVEWGWLRSLAELERTLEKKKDREADTFVDDVVMYEVLSELKDIAARDGISCACGSKGCSLDIHGGAVDLVCPACGGRLRLPAAADGDLDRLCCQYTLVIPGKKYPPPESGGSC